MNDNDPQEVAEMIIGDQEEEEAPIVEETKQEEPPKEEAKQEKDFYITSIKDEGVERPQQEQ